MFKKACNFCQVVFESSGRRQRFCSRRCGWRSRGPYSPEQLIACRQTRADRSTVPHATRTPTREDLYWAAGFLEGEGCFGSKITANPQHASIAAQASQVNREPLEWLQEIFGGSIRSYPSGRPRQSPHYTWRVCGARARGVVFTLFSLLSKKRQTQVRCSLNGL